MNTLPQHIAIIMDGNGRWAQRRMLPRFAGHRKGVEALRVVVQRCIELKISALTLFAFSSENWRRPITEVKLLMGLLQDLLLQEVAQLHENNVKLCVIGELQRLAPELQQAITAAQEQTKDNTGLNLNIALNYGGRWDIVQAARDLYTDLQAGKLELADVNEELFHRYTCLSHIPEPDLLIRSSGEQRISNFLLWQIAYTEIYFTDTLWPDFNVADLQHALEFYQQRQRRFGIVSENIGITQHA